VLTLNAAGKQPVLVLLTGLTPQTATLQIDGAAHTVPLPLLANAWAGGFATLWRMAADMPDPAAMGRGLANTAWLGNQLGQLSGYPQPLPTDSINQRGQLEAAVASRVNAFQQAQGLPADSQVGPLTLMQLNRAMGASEPRLQNAQP
jgi:general secretion pathway protein A